MKAGGGDLDVVNTRLTPCLSNAPPHARFPLFLREKKRDAGRGGSFGYERFEAGWWSSMALLILSTPWSN